MRIFFGEWVDVHRHKRMNRTWVWVKILLFHHLEHNWIEIIFDRKGPTFAYYQNSCVIARIISTFPGISTNQVFQAILSSNNVGFKALSHWTNIIYSRLLDYFLSFVTSTLPPSPPPPHLDLPLVRKIYKNQFAWGERFHYFKTSSYWQIVAIVIFYF